MLGGATVHEAASNLVEEGSGLQAQADDIDAQHPIA